MDSCERAENIRKEKKQHHGMTEGSLREEVGSIKDKKNLLTQGDGPGPQDLPGRPKNWNEA